MPILGQGAASGRAGQAVVGEAGAFSSPAIRLATQCYRGCSSWETSPTFSRTRTLVSLVRPSAPRDNRTARTEHRETIQHETLRIGLWPTHAFASQRCSRYTAENIR